MAAVTVATPKPHLRRPISCFLGEKGEGKVLLHNVQPSVPLNN